MRVSAVIVAYNRRELLIEALHAIEAQTKIPNAIIIVDNASTDSSGDAASAAFPDADLIRLGRNTGGAGGFAVGIERAITHHSADFVWVMDDDTIPSPDALEHLLAARSAHSGSPIVLASRATWTDGSDHPMNTPRRKPFVSRAERRSAQEIGCEPIRSASFVSLLIEARAVQKGALPCADYFIWNDDFEFTARLLRSGTGLYCPASVVLHKTRVLGSTDADPGSRFFYEVRNKIWLFRHSRALAWYEKPLYIAASARRWARTFLRSTDRSILRKTFQAGWSAGWNTSPRSNTETLADLGDIGVAVRDFERTTLSWQTR